MARWKNYKRPARMMVCSIAAMKAIAYVKQQTYVVFLHRFAYDGHFCSIKLDSRGHNNICSTNFTTGSASREL
jgi:hypothetical protein